MKLLLIFFVLSAFIKGQEYVITSSVMHSVISGCTMYHQMQDRNYFRLGDTEKERYHSKTWHALQTAEITSGIGVGITIGLDALEDSFRWDVAASDILIAGAVRWIVRDGVYQLLLNNSFFNLSNNTTAQFEKFGTPVIKLSILVIVVLTRYLLIS